MSVNPLFSGPIPNKRPTIYNNGASPGQRMTNPCILRQSNRNPNNMNFGGSPAPRKRPRVGDARMSDPMNESDPFKDFNDTFTEDDLEAFDMIASQAFSQLPHPNHGQAQAQERPTSTPRFQPKTNSLGLLPTTHVTNNNNITIQTESSEYGSLQQSNSVGNSSRFSFKPTSIKSGPVQSSATSVMPHHAPTSTFPKQVQNNSHVRQSNVVGTKIYYPHSSQHRSGSTPPDSTKAHTLGPNRQMVQPKQTVQSNVGLKITSSLSKPEPYSSTATRSVINPTSNIPQGFQTDVSDKNTSYNAKAGVQSDVSNAGGTFHSNPGVGGGSSTTSLTPPKGSVARESPGLPTTRRDNGTPAFQQQQLEKYKSEYETMKQQMKHLTEDQLTKDGEIQVLRQNLTKFKAEISRLHQERLQAVEQNKLQISEIKKQLTKENESLKTQLQFKEMELMQAHNASQNHHTRPPIASTSNSAPATPPKRISTSAAQDTKDVDMFPTQQSFMANNPMIDKGQHRSPRARTVSESRFVRNSPRKSPRKSPRRSSGISPGKMSPAPYSLPLLTSSSSIHPSKPPGRIKTSCLLSSKCQKAFSADAQVVGSLLQDEDAHAKSTTSIGGLMALVQTSTVYDIVSRDGTDTGQTSPDKVNSASSDHRKQTSSLNVELATRAISNLLNPPRIPLLPPNVTPPSESPFHLLPNQHYTVGSATYITDILPLLEDQLTIYIDTTRSISLKNATCSTCPSSSSSGGSRALESSFDSSGSSSPSEDSVSLGHAEAAVLTSLALLCKMVTCSAAVRTAILNGSLFKDLEPSGSDDDLSAMEIDPSAPLIDPTQAPKKSNAPSTIIHKSLQESISKRHTNNIKSKLMRIASMQHGLGSCGSVVELSLDALSTLTKKCNTKECERLQSVLVHDALFNGMSPESTFTQASHALDILSSLSLSWKLACKLCNQSDTCLLLQCYQCGIHGPQSCSTPQKIQLTVKVISLLWRIISSHHQGAAMMLNTDCQCSMELINAAVLMLRRVLDVTLSMTVNEHPTQYWRCVLHEGLLLLHCLAMHDRNFIDHRLDVEKFHVYSLTSLIKLYHKIPDITENETGLLQDLWEFDFDTEWEDENEPQGLGNMEADQ